MSQAGPALDPVLDPVPDPVPEPSPSAPRGSSGWRPSYLFLVAVTVLTLAADIASKQWIKRASERWMRHRAEFGHARETFKIALVKGHASLIYANNRGGAWGILQGEHEALRRPFFLVVSVAAIVFIISLYRKLTPGQRALRWGLPLVLGGALGNLLDRIIYGWVIDFIDVYTRVSGEERHWPTFNVADIAICVGVGLMAIDMFSAREKKKRFSRFLWRDEARAAATAAASAEAPRPVEVPPESPPPPVAGS